MKAREDAVKGRNTELEQSAKAQAIERGRLEELERKVKAEEAELGAKVKVLAKDRTAFALLEERSRVALKTLYEKGLAKPLTTDEDGPAQLLPYLVEALEEVADGEARVLSSAALTCISATSIFAILPPALTSCWSLWTTNTAQPLLQS